MSSWWMMSGWRGVDTISLAALQCYFSHPPQLWSYFEQFHWVVNPGILEESLPGALPSLHPTRTTSSMLIWLLVLGNWLLAVSLEASPRLLGFKSDLLGWSHGSPSRGAAYPSPTVCIGHAYFHHLYSQPFKIKAVYTSHKMHSPWYLSTFKGNPPLNLFLSNFIQTKPNQLKGQAFFRVISLSLFLSLSIHD